MSQDYVQMKEVTDKEFREFTGAQQNVFIGETKIRIGQPKKIKQYQPEHFELERTNAWSFPTRGSWATHKGDYRGNWKINEQSSESREYANLKSTSILKYEHDKCL